MALIEDLLLSKSVTTVSAIVAVVYFIGRSLEANVDAEEPPAIRSHIPFIGNLIRSIREQSAFLTNLGKEHRLPIATIPILKEKLYAIWDPILVQSAYCSKDLSFIPFAVDNVRSVTGYDDFSHGIVSTTDILPTYFKSIYEGTTAKHIHQLNITSLQHVSLHINAIGKDGFDAPNIYLWLRNLMTVATCEALFGPRNPIRSDELVEDVWTFETGLPVLFLRLLPSKLLRDTLAARRRLQLALGEYCESIKDDDADVSAYISNRVRILRQYGIEGQRVGDIEVALIHVPTSNSIPTLFWFFIYIFTHPDLVLRLRAEVEPFAERGPAGDNDVTINVDNLTERCPLLMSTYREVSRICNHFTCNRRVIKDTTITDGQGRSYVLKKGAAIQMPSYPLHSLGAAWGTDVEEFRPERFMDTGLTSEEAKLRRAAHTPFGGGAHMCPGRNFATAEIVGFVAAMLIGYHVEPADGNWDNFKPPPMAQCPMATAVCKPENEGSVFGTRVTRRSGWETAQWKFTSKSERRND